MERVCFLARVRPERLDEYRERHRDVSPVFRGARGVVPPEPAEPDMRAALRETGWGNYSLFLGDDGLLVGYLETQHYQAALDAMAATEVNKRWQAEMAGFFVADGPPDQSFARIPEVFHLDEEQAENA